MYVLMIVTYPGCNIGGEPCREVIDFFHGFETMVAFTEHWMARTIMEDRSEADDNGAPGWDYMFNEELKERFHA